MSMNEAECILYSNNFLSILTHSEVFFFFFCVRFPFVFSWC
jgi:hypothetical protein